MTKFHVAANGRTEPCTARKRACPRGGAEVHYDSVQEAIQDQLSRIESDRVALEVEQLEVRVKARIHEARIKFLEEGGTVADLEKRESFANAAPLDLREYFYSDSPFKWNWSETFNASRATLRLISEEHGEGQNDAKSSALKARLGNRLRDDGKPPLLDSVVRLARPDFANSEEWYASDERKVMATHLPNSLARIEQQIAKRDHAAA